MWQNLSSAAVVICALRVNCCIHSYGHEYKSVKFSTFVVYSYDVILTAETIYKPDNYCKLTHIFTNLLSPAGKMYPFIQRWQYSWEYVQAFR